ncbi:Gfo/Idh/MocA family oxidoreductase [Gymnodinialimonas sp. 2305UL16-5]|uniref:Gfo/Idh/MocA family protein n=1 Tax=Gymnodinialimonas mytili TaxID=3126503 RepID=UPI0030B3A861
MTPFGLAVIGCGMGAKPHAGALKELAPDVVVRGVFARDPARRAAFCAEHGFPEAESLTALAQDPDIQAALILTPPNARAELVDLFVSAGKPILMEKPVERDFPRAAALVARCREAGVPLGIVFQHRFRAASEALTERLARGEFGRILVAAAEVPWWRDQAYYDEPGRGSYARDGGGVLISQAIHTLDLMLSLTGPVAQIQAMTGTLAHDMEAEDWAAAALHFASGAMGHIVASTAAYPGAAESIRLDCERASVRLASGVLDIHWRDGRHEQIGESATTGGGADPMAFPCDWHRDLIADFVDAVRHNRVPRVTGAEALHVHRLIGAIERSAKTGTAQTLDAE